MPKAEDVAAREERLRRVAVQLVAQLGNEEPEDMALALSYAQELVEGWIRPGNGSTVARLHSIRNVEKNVS